MERKIIVGYDGSIGARDALVLGGLLGDLTGRSPLLAAFFDDDPVRYARADDARELHAYPDALDARRGAGCRGDRPAVEVMQAAGTFEDLMALVPGQDDIGRQLEQLGAKRAVDDEFAKLKTELGPGPPPREIGPAEAPVAEQP